MAFIQIIEYKTDRPEEVDALLDEWEADSPDAITGVRGSVGQDRENPGTWVNVVEFPSYEAAMENSNRPETTAFAERMAKLCDGPATFRNIEVTRQFQG